MIKIRRWSVKEHNGNIYKAVRTRWVMGSDRLAKVNSRPHHVAAILDGKCVGLYAVPAGGWKKAEPGPEDQGPRYEFDGIRAADEIRNRYVGLRWPHKNQFPVQLIGFD